MSHAVYIRRLVLDDAKTSYKWRNNSVIWEFTKFRPQNIITEEIELAWLNNCLNKKDERRFAICLKENDQYIGNVQLLKIANNHAEFHLVIGEQSQWGKGLGTQASIQILTYGFQQLRLESISLEVHKDNHAAFSIYKKIGFLPIGDNDDFVHMLITKNIFNKYHQKKEVF